MGFRDFQMWGVTAKELHRGSPQSYGWEILPVRQINTRCRVFMNNWANVEGLEDLLDPHCSACHIACPDGWKKSSEMMRDSAVNQTVGPSAESVRRFRDLSWTFSLCCEASIVMSLPSVYLFNVLSDSQSLNTSGQLIHFVPHSVSPFNSDGEVLKGNFAHVREKAEKAVLVRLPELRGADTRSVTATTVGAERNEGHREDIFSQRSCCSTAESNPSGLTGPAGPSRSQRTAAGGRRAGAHQRVTLTHSWLCVKIHDVCAVYACPWLRDGKNHSPQPSEQQMRRRSHRCT